VSEFESPLLKYNNRMYSLCRYLPEFESSPGPNIHNVSTIASQSFLIRSLSLLKGSERNKEKWNLRTHLEIHGEADGFHPRGGAILHSTAVHARRSLT
jgi:hypothetical protein